jgi:AAA+ ATPase superfamily predicted ATPase
MSFIGRKTELERLSRFASTVKPSIAVIYGRRRIGKSLLIQQSLQGKEPLFFEALEERPKRDQINHFMFQLQRLTGRSLGKPRHWKDALLELYEAIENNPKPIVFDEFQWMANYRHELVSELKFVWERHFSTLRGQKLILCGSIASFMVEKVFNSSALYGRIDTEIELAAFKLPETRQMLPEKGIDEVLEAHMLTGGVPKYLELLRDYPSVQLAMQDLAFQPNGYFTTEYQRIFVSHFGKNADFEAIVRVLAAHPLGLLREELARKAKISLGGQLSALLRDLESAGFLSADTPFHRGAESRHIKYFLQDAYLRLYFAFIRPNLKTIRSSHGVNFPAVIYRSGAFQAWLGRSFEYLCLQHSREIARIVGFSAVDFTVGPYFAPSRKNRPGVQVDLVFDRADNVLTVCEMKYSRRTVGIEVIAEMERKIELLQPASKGKTIQTVLIVRDTPSQDLIDRGYFYRVIQATDLIALNSAP